MPLRGTRSMFLDDAIEMLREADRLHRQFFRFAIGRAEPCWEPPIDMIEQDRVLTIRVALPGVPAADVDVRTDGRYLHVSARRPPALLAGQTIHCLEIPHGRFERRIEMPPGRYELIRRDVAEGFLVLSLRRLA